MKLPKIIFLNWVCSDYLLSDFISNLEMKYMKLIQSIDAMIVDLANQKEDFETQIKEMNFNAGKLLCTYELGGGS